MYYTLLVDVTRKRVEIIFTVEETSDSISFQCRLVWTRHSISTHLNKHEPQLFPRLVNI